MEASPAGAGHSFDGKQSTSAFTKGGLGGCALAGTACYEPFDVGAITDVVRGLPARC